MTKHTPGPWETSVMSDGTEWGVCEQGGGDMLALAYGRNQEANARLIAAAPELLAALEKIVASLTLAGEPELASQCYQLEIARAAIAKAT